MIFGGPLCWIDGEPDDGTAQLLCDAWGRSTVGRVEWSSDSAAAGLLEAASSGLTFAAGQALQDLGVPTALVAEMAGAGDLGRLRVSEKDGRWHPDEGGPWRLIAAVRGSRGELLDLVALSSGDADGWSLWSGDGVIWGLDALDRAEDASAWLTIMAGSVEPDELVAARGALQLRLFSRPMDLLRGGGEGLCVLEWGRAALTELRCAGRDATFLADDQRAADRLRGLLANGTLPGVAVAPRMRRAA